MNRGYGEALWGSRLGLELPIFMKCIILLSSLLVFASFRGDKAEAVPADRLGSAFELIGKLGKPLGNVVTVAGVLTEGIGPKGDRGGPRLVVQRIQGEPTQEWIVLDLRPLEMTYWDEAAGVDLLGKGELAYGKSYELVGFETGRYLGLPNGPAGMDVGLVQGMGFHFSLRFETCGAMFMDPIEYSPDMFTEQPAILQGKASTKGGHSVMEGVDWQVVVKRNEGWPKHVEGRVIETHGTYKQASSESSKDRKRFDLSGDWRLKKLADQVGRKVSLRGQLVVVDDKAALFYRGSLILVEAALDPSEDLYAEELSPFLLEGDLALAPPGVVTEQQAFVSGGLENGYVVTGATWKRLPALLTPDKPLVW